MDAGTQPASGQFISTYRVIRRLGSGGMGEVYQALDTKLNREVALKFLTSHMPEDEGRRAALLNEARNASMLDHPNVGTIYGLETNDSGQPFIVMAYYEGLTLAQRLRQGRLDSREAADIALQIASGLSAAHARNLIHRDIKPANVILTGNGLVKILDFGIAKAVHTENSTQTMGLSGTMSYMSPEQVEGKSLDARCDVWALGAVIFEMLLGHSAFHRETDASTLYSIIHSPVPPLGDQVPLAMQQVVYRSLAKNPRDRYQNAGEMIQDLKAFLNVGSATGHDAVSRGQISRFRRLASASHSLPRWSWRLALVSVVIFLALVTPAFWSRLFPPPVPHLVALPLVTDTDNQPLADGFIEALTSRLSNYQDANPNLWIVPTGEVRRRKVTDAASAQKTLGANLVITGSLERRSNALHLMLNLIDAANPASLRQLGSAELSSASGDLASLEDQAVSRIASLMHLKDARAPVVRTQTSSAYESYVKAIGYLQRFDRPENIDNAIGLLQSAIQADPNFPLAYSSLAQAYLAEHSRTKDPAFLAEAEQQADKAVSLDKDIAASHVVMGKVQHERGNDDLALEEFQLASKIEPKNADALFGVADVYQSQGRLADAESTLRKAAALRPEYWEGYNRLGIFLKRQSRFDEAAGQFQRVIELTPDNASGYSNLGGDLLEQGKLSEAQQNLEKALQLSPAYAIYANLGILYTKQHNYEKAAQATRQALQMSDKDWRVWSSLGTIYRWMKREDQAVKAYSRAASLLKQSIQIQSTDASTQAVFAEFMAFIGQQQKARQQLESALALAPQDPEVLMGASNVYAAFGDRGRALVFANQAVAHGLTASQLDESPESQWLKTTLQFHQPGK